VKPVVAEPTIEVAARDHDYPIRAQNLNVKKYEGRALLNVSSRLSTVAYLCVDENRATFSEGGLDSAPAACLDRISATSDIVAWQGDIS